MPKEALKSQPLFEKLVLDFVDSKQVFNFATQKSIA